MEGAEWVSIIGFGSLLSPRSAKGSFPSLRNFRIGVVHGYRRIYDHVGVIFLEKGIADKDSLEIASVAAEPAPGVSLLVAVFEIHASDFPAFVHREIFFRVTPVDVAEHPDFPWPAAAPGGVPASPTAAHMCLRFRSEAELVATNFSGASGGRAAFDALVRPWYAGDIFRRDIRPCRVYLKHCLTAAERLAPAVLDNFLDTTVLADGVTTVRAYLAANPLLLDAVVLGAFDRYSG